MHFRQFLIAFRVRPLFLRLIQTLRMKAVVHNSRLQANPLNRVLRYASSLLLESLLLRYLTRAAVEGGMPAKETNPELSAIRQQLEMYEGSPTQSPFQAGGAMEELRRQSMDVKRSVGDLPRSIRGDVGVFLSNLSGQTAAPAPTAARSAAKEIQQQLGRMSERDQVQYQGGLKGFSTSRCLRKSRDKSGRHGRCSSWWT